MFVQTKAELTVTVEIEADVEEGAPGTFLQPPEGLQVQIISVGLCKGAAGSGVLDLTTLLDDVQTEIVEDAAVAAFVDQDGRE